VRAPVLPQVGSNYFVDVPALAAPSGLRLYLAGEATSVKYPSTVHGAYLSGVAVADSVAAAAQQL
jgi:predicted NAD/FAD-dependent oxidoreductase